MEEFDVQINGNYYDIDYDDFNSYESEIEPEEQDSETDIEFY